MGIPPVSEKPEPRFDDPDYVQCENCGKWYWITAYTCPECEHLSEEGYNLFRYHEGIEAMHDTDEIECE